MKSTLLMFLPALAIGALALASPEAPAGGACCKKACPPAAQDCNDCKDCPPACKAGKALDAALAKLAAISDTEVGLEREARKELAAQRIAGIDRVGQRKEALRAAADLLQTAARVEMTSEKPNSRRAELLLKIAAGHDRVVAYLEAAGAPPAREAKAFDGKEDADAAVAAVRMAYDTALADLNGCCGGAKDCCPSKDAAKHEPAAEVVGAVRAMMGAMKAVSAEGDPCVKMAADLTMAACAGCCADWAECCETAAPAQNETAASGGCPEKAAG